MPIKRSRAAKFQRKLRLILSDFFHLVAPSDRSVFTWKDIFIWSVAAIFLVFLAWLATNA